MAGSRRPRIDTDGLRSAGLWARRVGESPSLTDEAMCLAQVLQTWKLCVSMSITHHDAVYAEVSGPSMQPRWVYLVELVGRRTEGPALPSSHPLSRVAVNEEVRLLAVVLPDSFIVPGIVAETATRRRPLWLQVVAEK